QVDELTAHLEIITQKEKKARRDGLAAARSDATAEGGRRISQLLQFQRAVRQAQGEGGTPPGARRGQAAQAPRAAGAAGGGGRDGDGWRGRGARVGGGNGRGRSQFRRDGRSRF